MAWGAKRGIDDIVARVRANDPTLRSLCLMRTRKFEQAEAAALCAALVSSRPAGERALLEELIIGSHAITLAMAATFAELLAAPNCPITSLSLGNRTFGDEGLAALCPGIQANSSLQRLDLEAKGLTAAGCAPLAGALTANSTLQELILSQNELGQEGIAALAPGLLSLRLLDLGSTGLEGAAACEPLAKALKGGRLQVLLCEGNPLGPAGAEVLAPASACATSLGKLSLTACALGPEGAAALAPSLPASLRELDLSSNGIGDAGAAALAAALEGSSAASGSSGGGGSVCSSLGRLVLCDNGISDSGVHQLAAALAAAGGAGVAGGSEGIAAPLELDLGGNSVGEAGLAALAACMRLAALRLHNCRLGAAGAAALAALLTTQQGSFASLRELDLSGCGLGEEGILALLRAFLEGASVSPSATVSAGTAAAGGDGTTVPGSAAADEATTSTAGAASCCCPQLRLLVLAANEGLESEGVVSLVEALQEARPELTVVRRAGDSGEAGREAAG